MQAAVSAVVREASTLFVRTPPIETYWPLLPQPLHEDVDNTVSEGDIGFATKNTLAGDLIVVDFTITASVKGAELKYEQAGDIANAAEIAKVKQYQARYNIPDGNIIGFAIETSGAWGPAAKRLVWSIAEAGGGPQDIVARRYRRNAEQISVALQVALYGSHLCFLTVSANPGSGSCK